jgi:hypothetical protein
MQTNLYQADWKPEILVFKTNIKTKKRVKEVSPILDGLPLLTTWSVDTQDIDNVLRVVITGNVQESDIVNLLISQGFYCEALED